MPDNIFLTGSPQVGKTTIIKRVITEAGIDAGGFMVRREGQEYRWKSFYLQDAAVYFENREVDSSTVVFAYRDKLESPWEINIKAFNDFGVKLLNKAVLEKEIVIMDELGRFELEAEEFCKKVEDILGDSIPVFGVIKDEQNSFLDNIRERSDVKIYRVDLKNRDYIFNIVLQEIKDILKLNGSGSDDNG
jgi:nucleoside-triphosphatase